MFAETHAAASTLAPPDDATDAVLTGAYAGWDARVYIPEPGADPFEGIADEDLLHGNAGVIAATVLAQANQMRILDSAIVPDRDLARPTENPTGKFNEFDVYTPTTLAERYAVINEEGVEEVVTPSAPFYPGLSHREDASQSAIQLKLEDESEDPYKIALATGTALLQIGVEAGKDVTAVAEILNAAWGVEDAFSPGTVVGLAGTREYAALFAQDRNTNARRVASWQETSYVRSGQLAMQASDWGPNLHCDFRRVRVAAESLFATSMAAETQHGGVRPTGKITYHVPSTSLLSADPQYLFFQEPTPHLLKKQDRCPAAADLLDQVDRLGILRALWPSTEPEIASTWAATFATAGGLSRARVEFVPRPMSAAPLFSSSTTRLVPYSQSVSTGMGNTVMTTLSARLATMAENVVDIQTVGWLARFAAVVEIMRMTTSREARIIIAKKAWASLNGDPTRDLERSLSKAHMGELKRNLPTKMKAKLHNRSARIPVYALLLEVGAPTTQVSHTVLRGLRRAFARAADVAMAVSMKEKVGWRTGDEASWLKPRLAVIREFWAVQFAALGQVAHVASALRNDLRWWVEVSASVNMFRAGIMRGFSVADTEDSVAFTVRDVPVKLRPYHAAAHLKRALAPYFADSLPDFASGERVTTWAHTLATHTADHVRKRRDDIPRVCKVGAVADHTSHFTRGAELLGDANALSTWIKSTTSLVADDCAALLDKREIATAAACPGNAEPMSTEMVAALTTAADNFAEAIAKIDTAMPTTDMYAGIMESVSDDMWDDFTEAAWDEDHPMHEAAARQLEHAKTCTDPGAAAGISRWIEAHFAEEEEESGAALI